MQLARFPRYRLGHLPTPMEPMSRLAEHLHSSGAPCPQLWIKRDDCTGLATGGNKTRKLEYLVGDALERGADTLITQGATQSNHARQTAAAAAVAGMDCQLLLERRVEGDAEYEHSGNVLLDRILGAEIADRVPAGTDMDEQMQRLAGDLQAKGRRPYVIPGGGSNPIGALGYVGCAEELAASPHAIDVVVHATGSTGTQAGLLAGMLATSSGITVHGISVRQPEKQQRDKVLDLAQQCATHLGLDAMPEAEQVHVDDRFVGRGYGISTEESSEAIELLARTEGILLDPVYSGKAMAGLVRRITEGSYSEQDTVVFLHTGGAAGLFGYRGAFE